jgi:hypothetical protein
MTEYSRSKVVYALRAGVLLLAKRKHYRLIIAMSPG